MNRKRKTEKGPDTKKKLHFDSLYDDPLKWLGQRFDTPPWSDDQIEKFQLQIDSAFGDGSRTLILAWSGDRRYWDGFYTDWHFTGLAKEGSFERTPLLPFGQYRVNDTDYVTVIAPRWLILEPLHRSQYETDWESAMWSSDADMAGGRKQIRAAEPPEFLYDVLFTIAEHETPIVRGAEAPCCERLWKADKRMCFGKYRPPSDTDIATIRGIRERQDKAGVAQRNDAPREKKVLENASLATKHHILNVERQKASASKEWFIQNHNWLMKDFVAKTGTTKSASEIGRIIKDGLDAAENARFSKE